MKLKVIAGGLKGKTVQILKIKKDWAYLKDELGLTSSKKTYYKKVHLSNLKK